MRSMFTWKSMTLAHSAVRSAPTGVKRRFSSTKYEEIRGIIGAKFLLTPASYIPLNYRAWIETKGIWLLIIRNIAFNKETGEIVNGESLELDEEKSGGKTRQNKKDRMQ